MTYWSPAKLKETSAWFRREEHKEGWRLGVQQRESSDKGLSDTSNQRSDATNMKGLNSLFAQPEGKMILTGPTRASMSWYQLIPFRRPKRHPECYLPHFSSEQVIRQGQATSALLLIRQCGPFVWPGEEGKRTEQGKR